MKKAELREASVEQLVQRFVQIALAQDEAILRGQTTRFNRLYDQMNKVDDELRRRGQEARLALVGLYGHPNPQVRLKAAIRTLGIAPAKARSVLEAIRASREQPQALDAGVTIAGLDDGSFKPT